MYKPCGTFTAANPDVRLLELIKWKSPLIHECRLGIPKHLAFIWRDSDYIEKFLEKRVRLATGLYHGRARTEETTRRRDQQVALAFVPKTECL